MIASKLSEDEILEALEPLELEVVDEPEPFYVSIGEIVADKYRVESVLGAGGMGVVLSAKHVDLGERFALKFLNEEFMRDEVVIHRFTQEARAACRIRNEHVARVYDVGAHHGAPFLVMEHLEGSDLASIVKERGALPIEDAVEYTMQACEALADAHRHGIIHRDIKPENLFLVEQEGLPSIKVLDFGISKTSLTGGDAPSRLTGQLSLGTPCYMSPEQIRSTATVDGRSDLWSLAVVLYELLAGIEAFRAPTVTGICAAVLEDEPEPLTTHRPDLPPGLAEVIERCLAKDPDHRYADIADFAEALYPFAPARALVSVERTSSLLRAAGPDSARRVTAVRATGKQTPARAISGNLDSGPVSHAPIWSNVAPTPPRQGYGRTIALAAAVATVIVALIGLAGHRERAVATTTLAATAPPPVEEATLPAASTPAPVNVAEGKRVEDSPRPAAKRPIAIAPKTRLVASAEHATAPSASQAPSSKPSATPTPPPAAATVELGY